MLRRHGPTATPPGGEARHHRHAATPCPLRAASHVPDPFTGHTDSRSSRSRAAGFLIAERAVDHAPPPASTAPGGHLPAVLFPIDVRLTPVGASPLRFGCRQASRRPRRARQVHTRCPTPLEGRTPPPSSTDGDASPRSGSGQSSVRGMVGLNLLTYARLRIRSVVDPRRGERATATPRAGRVPCGASCRPSGDGCCVGRPRGRRPMIGGGNAGAHRGRGPGPA